MADYVRDQRVHHAKVGFQDEFRATLRKHEVEFDVGMTAEALRRYATYRFRFPAVG